MLFQFFKRSRVSISPSRVADKSPKSSALDSVSPPGDPGAMDVTEGSAEDDWDLWQHSVEEFDSKFAGLPLTRNEIPKEQGFGQDRAEARLSATRDKR